jgi:hypothetical protein
MTMRSDAEIRKQVETRLRRWGLLFLDGGLGVLVVFFLYQFSKEHSFGEPLASWLTLFVLGWFVLGLLHTAYVLYVEVREWLVSRAINREREFYALQNAYEKHKRDDSASRNTDAAHPLTSEDGELIDFPYHEAEESDYAQRSRNS